MKNTTIKLEDELRQRLIAFQLEYNDSDIEIKESGNMPSHYQEDVNLYLLDKAANLIGQIIALV
jgi:hypothetical protein